MTAEEIANDVLAALERGAMTAEEAVDRLIAVGMSPEDARNAVLLAVGRRTLLNGR